MKKSKLISELTVQELSDLMLDIIADDRRKIKDIANKKSTEEMSRIRNENFVSHDEILRSMIDINLNFNKHNLFKL